MTQLVLVVSLKGSHLDIILETAPLTKNAILLCKNVQSINRMAKDVIPNRTNPSGAV